MAGEAPQVRYAAMHTPAGCATPCACAALRPPCGAQPAERWTLWVKRTDVEGAQYASVKGVDVLQTVDDFKARWVSDKKLDVDPSLVTLRLVKCSPGVPTASEEAQAAPLEPRLTLREAGVADGSSLLADFAAGVSAGARHVSPACALPTLCQREPRLTAPRAAFTALHQTAAAPLVELVLALGQLGLFSAPAAQCSSSSTSSKSEQKREQKRAQATLRMNALEAYGHIVTDGMLRCPVLCTALPAAAVTCAHLVPRMLRAHWAKLGIAEEDPRNVMFIFKCVEEAFDDHLLSFVRTGTFDANGRDLFRVYVWDPTLLDLPVSVNVRNRNERRELPGVQLPESVERTTFRSLHERAPVVLAGPSGMSPFRRALVLQSILARAKACHNGWPDAPPELAELDDAVSPDMSPEKEETVRAWRVAAAAAGSAAVADRGEEAR